MIDHQIPTFTARPHRVGRRFTSTTVEFQCPKCAKWNMHGYGDGHRVSHCSCWPNGYYLKSSPLERRRQNRIRTEDTDD